MSPISSKLLKTWSGVTRVLLWALLSAWLLFGVIWSAVHWVIVPRIGEFRPQLEARATKALGVPVRLGAITAHSNGLMPSFVLSDVTLIDDQGRVALSLARVLVTVSPRSLWRRGFEQIYIDQPALDVRRGSDGRLHVAGLDVSGAQGSDTGAQDWFFSQVEFVIRGGSLRWIDEQRALAPLVLSQVDFVSRNVGRHHDIRLDATPPDDWGARFQIQARFLQELLTRRNGHWQRWQGQVFADFPQIDASQLQHYLPMGVDLRQGRGAMRTWLDVNQGQVSSATVDLAMTELAVALGPKLPEIDLSQLTGRIRTKNLAKGFELAAQSLAFQTRDGLQWQQSNFGVVYQPDGDRTPARTELTADHLDLAVLTGLADSLPLDEKLRSKLAQLAPKGQVTAFAANWIDAGANSRQYAAKGQLTGLVLAATGDAPGVQGLDVDFELDQKGGSARIAMQSGGVDVPTFFEQGLIGVDQLTADARWQVTGDQIAVQMNDLKFANADTQGQATIKWQTSDPRKSPSRSRFPGILDLQATLDRADGRQVHRYLPLVIDAQARSYVRDAVQAGTASKVRFVVKGDIYDMPATDPKKGTFRISADVEDARLLYVPPSLQEKNDRPWPVLHGLSGELVIDRTQLSVNNARGWLGEGKSVQVIRADALIADLLNAEVRVNAELKAPLAVALTLVNQSPLADLTGQVLKQAVVNGQADYNFRLALPIANIRQSSVQGSVVLAGNDVQINPESPKISRARGSVNFSHTGFSLADIQARMLGGEVRLDGGLEFVNPDSSHPKVIRATGTATAEGLQQAVEMGFVARLATRLGGSAQYTAVLGLRRDVLELLVSSNLQGLSARLPPPFNKDAQSLLPLRYQTAILASLPTAPPNLVVQDRLTLTLGRLMHLVLDRDVSGAQPVNLRGAIGVGADTLDSVVLPPQGINANLHVPQLDVDAWADVLDQLDAIPTTGSGVPLASSLGLALLPNNLAVQADQLTYGARQYNQVVLGAGRDGTLWRVNVVANQLDGYIEYRQPATTHSADGRVYARLARLTVAPSVANEVEALLDAQPASVPALDVIVDDFELRGKRLGRLEVDAINRLLPGAQTPEWRLNKLKLTVPEASLLASGNWVRLNASEFGQRKYDGALPLRRTALHFKLDIADGGGLLARFGMKDVVRQASGVMEGHIAWLGSPLKIDYPTLQGGFAVNVQAGQFLQADPGIAKLLGVLSLQALPRRLTLDFRDVFSKGFAFDFLRGDITVDKGLANTNNLQMKGVNAAVLMEGSADIAKETQDLKVIVVPELNAGTASLIATVINPAVGLGSFLAQLFLQRPLIESATQEFHVDGPWADPQVRQVLHTPAKQKESYP
ncbi:MAG: TIGR02099 family protein [Rhodoferax sp.]|nr:TIGR02099 family protein [Rhodoferax sp.]MBP9734080.1 TIGR02099 family protein [Rhodoferax sp.]